jgi:hypothetical protein
MKLDEIFSQWKEDCKIDLTELAVESVKTFELHSKYLNLWTYEKIALNKRESEYKILFRLKFQYYAGTISDEDLKKMGWEPNPLRIIRQDIQMHMESDEQLIASKALWKQQEEKVTALEHIIKSINNRSFHINNAIADRKFKHGEN